MAIAPTAWRVLFARLCGLRLGFHFAALDKVDLGIEDDHVALIDAIAYFHLRSQIPRHGYFSDMGLTTLDHGDLQAVAIENDRRGGHETRRRGPRHRNLEPATSPRDQRALRIRNIYFGWPRYATTIQLLAAHR